MALSRGGPAASGMLRSIMKPPPDAIERAPRPPPGPGAFRSRAGRDAGWLLPCAVLVVGWAFSAWIFFLLQRDSVRRQDEFFSERVAEAQAAIRVRMTAYEDTLRGGTSFFTASHSVDRDEWRIYAASLQLSTRYPGINGLGVIFAVAPDGVPAWQARVRAEGEPLRQITPFPDNPEKPGDPKYLITFLEGNVGDNVPIGRNIATEASRRRAAELARDTGEPRLHHRVPGSRDTQRRSGLILYVPLYTNGARLDTVADRRAAHLGWVYAQVHPDLFLKGVLGPMGETLRLHFFEPGGLSRERLLYSSVGLGDPLPATFDRISQMEMAGQVFQLGWQRGPRFPTGGSSAAVWAGSSLAVASLLLAGLVASLQSVGRRANAIASERTVQLAASEVRLRLFAEHAPASVAMVDREMRYLVVSREWMRANRVKDDIIGRSHYDISEQVGQRWRAVHRRCLAGAIERSEAELFVRPDGSKQWQRWEVRPWFDAAGQIGGVVMLTADITERKQLEESLAVARDEALAASRLKSEFLATMSHEIRTPMNAIIGMTSFLAESALPAEQREMTRVLQGSAEGLLTIINDILDFSKIEAGKLRLEPADFDLRQVVDQTIALFAPRLQEQGLALKVEVALAPSLMVRGDAGRVRQILSNLLGNAVKFTERGEVRVTAALEQETEAAVRVRIAVKDTGSGIAPEVQARLFQPFVQGAEIGRSVAGGTGLGLAISRQLVRAMGGEIGVESALGEGATFWFTLELPRAAGSPDQAPDAAGQSNPGSTMRAAGTRANPATFRPLRLLMAEDNRANQAVGRLMLARIGHQVDIVDNGEAALARLAIDRYDAVLMDCQMPVLDGYETTRRIRSKAVPGVDATVPIIAVTAYAMREDRVRCLEAGMDEYISKPMRAADLQAALQRCGLAVEAAVVREPPRSDSPVLDAQTLAGVRALPNDQGGALLHDLVAHYLTTAAGVLGSLERAVQSDAFDPLAQEAHALAGEVAVLGAFAMRTAALELEKAARAGDGGETRRRFVTLQAEAARLRDALGRLNVNSP